MHVFRKPSGSEEMMGRKFLQGQRESAEGAIAKAHRRLIESGCPEDRIHAILETRPYPTVAGGISPRPAGEYDVVIISRKRMSRSEEFILGDASVKVIRALDNVVVGGEEVR